MMKVFISGSLRITVLDPVVKDRLQGLMADNAEILIGDAPGVDMAAQEHLHAAAYRTVTVYCSGKTPRNNLGQWPIVSVESTSRPGTREHFTAKDEKMAVDCDSGPLIWDGRSRGTRRNAIDLICAKKSFALYLATMNAFYAIGSADDFEQLVAARAGSAK